MLAIMIDQQQHTLLTRFVPVAPDEAELRSTIQKILADVDRVLPATVGLLAQSEPARICQGP
jgi:hypothetical protein